MFSLREYREPTHRLPDYLPWACLVAPGVVLQKDAILQKTVAFRGPALASSSGQAAAKASFDAFRADPEWDQARKASEAAAGGSLTVTNGVKSEFLTPTDYSPTK